MLRHLRHLSHTVDVRFVHMPNDNPHTQTLNSARYLAPPLDNLTRLVETAPAAALPLLVSATFEVPRPDLHTYVLVLDSLFLLNWEDMAVRMEPALARYQGEFILWLHPQSPFEFEDAQQSFCALSRRVTDVFKRFRLTASVRRLRPSQ